MYIVYLSYTRPKRARKGTWVVAPRRSPETILFHHSDYERVVKSLAWLPYTVLASEPDYQPF